MQIPSIELQFRASTQQESVEPGVLILQVWGPSCLLLDAGEGGASRDHVRLAAGDGVIDEIDRVEACGGVRLGSAGKAGDVVNLDDSPIIERQLSESFVCELAGFAASPRLVAAFHACWPAGRKGLGRSLIEAGIRQLPQDDQ